MCTGFSSAKFNPMSRMLGDKYKNIDPLQAGLERTEKKLWAKPVQTPTPTLLTAPTTPVAPAQSGMTLLSGGGY